MENPYSDNNFLARWLNNDLSLEEKVSFEKSADFLKYKKIVKGVDTLKTPSYDKEKLFNGILEGIKKETKTIRLVPKWTIGIAASLLVLIGVFFFFNDQKEFSTDYGEHITFKLPDGSEVTLNSRSSLKFKKSDWDENRIVTLDGEGFFKVKKGSDFLVKTTSGTVEVLGTQFNVNTQKKFFEVICHTGKVKAIGSNNEVSILRKGNAFRISDDTVENWKIETTEPAWLTGETTFRNTPLKQVIISLQNQFNISFDKRNIDENQRFTGSYNNKDIELALKTIFVPMEISFTFKDENHIVLSK